MKGRTMRDRLIRPGMLVYIAGIIINLAAIFTPYIRYKYTHELYMETSGSYSLFGINGIRDDFLGLGDPGITLKAVPVLLILAFVAGIICCVILVIDVNISRFIMFLAPALSVVGYLLVKFNSKINEVVDYVKDMEDSLLVMNYTGSGGYGIGAFLIITSIVIMIIGAVIICIEDY